MPSRVSNSDSPVLSEYVGAKAAVEATGLWWKMDEARVHASVFAVVESISKDQSARDAETLHHARLYANRELTNLIPGFRQTARPKALPVGRLKFNVVMSCVDTASAMIAKSKPRPQFLTSDGNGGLQRKAKQLTRYVEGVFYDGNAYDEAQSCFTDACVFGTGAVRLYWEEGLKDGDLRLKFERALPWEIYVDEEDGRLGKPKQLHHVRWTYADNLCELFPKKAEQIRAAVSSSTGSPHRIGMAGKVRVVESWHLPSGPKAKDGKHAISIEGCTLQVADWKADFFPYAFFRWNDQRVGFWGRGLAEELNEIQTEVNRTAMAIQQAQHLVATPRVFVEAGSNVVTAHVNNMPGGVVKYTGRAPIFSTPTAMNSEAYNWLQTNIDRAYSLSGISQLQASAQKPAGLDSGVALREYNDTAAVRFALTGQRWENLFLDLAKKTVAMSRQAYEGGAKKLSVNTSDGKFLRQIKWSEVAIEDDKFTMKVFPTSMLPTTPAGKLQTVQELVQAGLIPKEYAVSLLDFPDLEAFTSLQTAAIEDIRWTIDQILEEGIAQDADEVTDLKLAVTMGMSAVLNAKRANEPREHQELLRRWVDACKDRLEPPPAAAAPSADVGPSGAGGPGPDGGGQMAIPEAPPTSELMATSDKDAKVAIHAMSAEPARMMDAIGGGKSWRYKDDVPGEDSSETHYGTTTQDLEKTAMGSTMVDHNTNSDGTAGKYDAINLKDSVGPMLASLGNLNERLRALEESVLKAKGSEGK